MKPIIISIFAILAFAIAGIIIMVQLRYIRITPYVLDFTPPSRRISSRRYQVVTAHIQGLMSRGEEARRVGDLKTAEIEFKAVVADKSDFPSKQHYVTKAKAELGKIEEQRSHHGILRVPLLK